MYLPTLIHSVPCPGPNSALKSPPILGMYFFAICRVFLDRFVHFLDIMVRISRVGEVHTHQFDALVVDHDCGGDDTFVDVFSVNYSLPPLLVQHDTNAVFVVVSSCTHEYVFVMCLPYLCFVMPPRFTQ